MEHNMDRLKIIERAKQTHTIDYDYSLVTDTKTKDNVTIICPKHGVFKPRLERFLKGCDCKYCIGKGTKTTENFISEYNNKFGVYDLKNFTYINAHTKSIAICSKHGSFEITPTNLLNGIGCPKCKVERLKGVNANTNEEFIKKAVQIHGDKYDYSSVDYINNSTKINIKCNICGSIFKQIPHNHLQGKGCPFCNTSHMEEEVKKNLEERNIKYEYQKHFKWLGKQSIDFYLTDYNIGIECQGIQHFIQTLYGDVKENIERDFLKYSLCCEHNLDLFFILPKERGFDLPFFYNSENAFNSLKEMFNNMDRLTKFIEKARQIHGDKYDYSKVDYVDSLTKVCIICKEHGEFWQTPQGHIRGNNCPSCSNIKRGNTFRETTEQFIEKSKIIHDDKYDYSKVTYVNARNLVKIICKKHGEFEMSPIAHTYFKQGCPKCVGRNLTTSEIINKFKEIHGDKYDYSKVTYDKMHEKVCIICKEHGEFWQTPSKHLLGQGCPQCGITQRSKTKTYSTDDFIEKARQIHGDKYDYSKVVYDGAYEDVEIICKEHGSFYQRPNDHLNGHGCPKCGCILSKWENEIDDFIKSFGLETLRNKRNVLSDGKEIDIFIPSMSIGIECDGLKWHSEEYKDKKYHLNKTEDAFVNGIRLIHIYEDEWLYKQDIVKSILRTILGFNSKKIYARKCKIQEIESDVKKRFIGRYHIQGDVPSSINIGLFYDNELVSVMTFGSKRVNLGNKTKNEGEYELLRYCCKNNTNIIGGASKIFNYFIKHYQPKEIISYCDRRYSVGNIYTILGFNLDHVSQPNYYYIIDKRRENRFKYRKDVLVKQGFDINKTEHEIMLERHIYRIYDCGNLVYKW